MQIHVLSAETLAAEPWTEIAVRGGTARTVWKTDTSRAGLLRLEPGAGHPPVSHEKMECHVLVMAGSVTIAGQHLRAGSYAHVEPGANSGVTQAGMDGCTLFFHFVGDVVDFDDENLGHGHSTFGRDLD